MNRRITAMMPSRNRCVTLAVFGTLLIAFGTLLCVFLPTLYRRFMHKEISLSPTSTSFGMWKDTSKFPFYMDIYFFNWTNPHEIRIPGKKPKFVELGPYSFREKREKVNIVFHPENSTVSYDHKRTWHFTPERSNGSLSDEITQLNVVTLSAAHAVRYWTSFWQTGLSIFLAKIDDIYVTRTVDELLFAGYDDSLIKMGQLSQMVDLPPFDRFGWMYMRNGSLDFEGHYNMATGQDDLKNIGVIKDWNYGREIKFYDQPCNKIEGSAGEFWPPERTMDEISLYSVDICRPLTYEYERSVTHHGIVGYKYAIGEKTLSNSTKRRYPHEQAKYFAPSITATEDFHPVDNGTDADADAHFQLQDLGEETDTVDVGRCFCNGECVPSGLINVTACRYGAPAFVSLPHFHKADPYYRDLIEGMNPTDEKHGFHITLEPSTGIPIDVAARLQVNLLLQPMDYTGLYRDVPRIFFPMFWFNERVEITEEVAFPLRLFLRLPSIGFYSSVAIAFLGGFLLLIAGILHLLQKRRSSISNLKHLDIAPLRGHKSELIYLNTTKPNEDNGMREDRKLYPQLVDEKNHF